MTLYKLYHKLSQIAIEIKQFDMLKRKILLFEQENFCFFVRYAVEINLFSVRILVRRKYTMSRRGENIYKRKDGRWEGRYQTGHHENGKPKYRSVYGKSYQTVREQLLKLKAVPEQYQQSGKVTVRELFEEWLSAAKLRVKPSTYANYQMKTNKHILPEFGSMRYELLTAKMLHSFIQKKISSGLSPKYVSDIVVVFKSMSKYAAKVHHFRNPLTEVILPKSEKPEMKLLSEPEQKRLSAYLMKHLNPTSLCILLSLYTGLRVGEVCGLQWADIDFQKQMLTVRKTVQRIWTGNGTKLTVGTPKSRTSCRSIPVPEFLMKLLRNYRQDDNSYLLSGTEHVTEPRTLQHRFKAVRKKANLPSVNYHSLRHMFATNCIRIGFDVKTLSELLGHSSVETTLNRYVHSSMEQKIACMNRVQLAA